MKYNWNMKGASLHSQFRFLNPESWILKGPTIQRFKGPKDQRLSIIQRSKDPKVQRNKGSKIQRNKGTMVPRYNCMKHCEKIQSMTQNGRKKWVSDMDLFPDLMWMCIFSAFSLQYVPLSYCCVSPFCVIFVSLSQSCTVLAQWPWYTLHHVFPDKSKHSHRGNVFLVGSYGFWDSASHCHN